MLAIFRDREGKRLIEVGYHGRKNMVALALIRRGERGEREGGEERDGKKRVALWFGSENRMRKAEGNWRKGDA